LTVETDWCPRTADAAQFSWLLASGLGPLLYHACSACREGLPEEWRDALRSEELTARVLHAGRIETTLDILEACDTARVPAVLLKGISVSEQIYPAEHLRPMTDVDVLLPREARPAVEAALLQRGYTRTPWQYDPGSHHGAPLCQPRLRTFVELHFALFPAGSPLTQGTTFRPKRLLEQSIDSSYHGRPVRRLPAGLQLVYTAASWFNDLRTNGRPDPSHLPSAFDLAYLLRRYGSAIDWIGLLDTLDNTWVKTSLHLTLSYLPRYGVCPVPEEVLHQLSEDQTLVGPIQRRLIFRMLDRQLFGAQPWPHLWPPPVLGRYSFHQQVQKRILDRLPFSERGAKLRI
jgi:hypothetical protein